MAEDPTATADRAMHSENSAGEGSGGSASAAGVLRTLLVALAPPLIAFGAEKTVFASIGSRWLLMVAAVIVSASNGGMVTGLVATMTSAALVWWFLVPPVQTLGATDPRYYLFVVLFLVVGYAVSLLHERLRRATDRLTRTARQNQIFAALIENSLDFVGIADPEGKPIYVNPAGRQMVEMPAGVEVEHTQIPDYYPPDLRTFATDEILAAMLAQGKWAGETSFRNWRTGARIPVLDTHFLVRDPVTRRVIAMATITRDVSAQKAQRDALEQTNQRLATTMRDLAESQRFLQGILDYSPNAIVIKSLDGRYVIVNNAFQAITQVELDQMRGKSDADLFPAPLAQRIRANDARAVATHQAVVTEESMELAGDRRDYLVTKFPLFGEANTILAVCGIWTDITQRKRDEETLRQVASDLRTAQRVAHVGSWRWDVRTNHVEWSEELYRIFGLDPAQSRRAPLFTDPDSKVLGAETKALARDAVAKCLADGRPFEIELDFRRPDGSLRWVVARGEAVLDNAGRVVGITGTSADITRLKELQRLHEEWTSVIAHDLRQPIGTILMASEFLPDLRAGEPSEQERDMIRRIHSAAGSLRRMVDDLLDMSLLEANRLRLERTWANPPDLVRQTLERLAHLPGIERVRVRAGPDLPPIEVDPMRIEQVLQNLISNAIKYGDEQSEITVRVEQHDKELDIAVTNRGKGIAPDELPRLFDRFSRSRTTRGSGVPGLGLGLYISKGVVEAHDGRLWAESTPGETTTFHVALPVSAAMRVAA